jgi:hypothetical protein
MERKDREGKKGSKGSKGRFKSSKVEGFKKRKGLNTERARRKKTECTPEKGENTAPSEVSFAAPLTGQTGQEGAALEEHLMFWLELALRGS